MLRRYDPDFGADPDGPSPAEMAGFLAAASRLQPNQLKRLILAVREALAEDRTRDGD
jgi:hypothetical protein